VGTGKNWRPFVCPLNAELINFKVKLRVFVCVCVCVFSRKKIFANASGFQNKFRGFSTSWHVLWLVDENSYLDHSSL